MAKSNRPSGNAGGSPDQTARGLARVSKATQDAVASLLAAGKAASDQARATAAAGRQAAELNRQMLLMEARLKAGRLAVQRLGSGVGYAAAGAAAAAVAGARSGFRGTLEEQRFDYQRERLNRGLADAMSPFLRAVTDATEKLATFVNGLESGEQKVLRYSTAAVLGAAALHKVSTFFGGPGLGTMLARGGGLAGSGLGAAWRFGAGVAGSAAGAPLGIAGLGAAAAGVGAYSVLPGEKKDRVVNAISPFGPKTNSILQGLAEFLPTPGTIGRFFSAEGRKNLPNEIGERIKKAFGGGLGDPAEQVKKDRVTLAGGGFEAAGSAYYRVAGKYAQSGDTAAEKQIAAASKLQEAAVALAKVLGQMLGEDRKQQMR